ncbi:ribosomal protein rpl22 [Cystoisospora suis]|uniref:Ribosomal protein rpl22 n=1 Tax=Cystoisospora suis TaxID=483139 RepID=A0A2C6KIE9_9APIC|nr:ribosomal protein rpl22 [Cystoisospora suis]
MASRFSIVVHDFCHIGAVFMTSYLYAFSRVVLQRCILSMASSNVAFLCSSYMLISLSVFVVYILSYSFASCSPIFTRVETWSSFSSTLDEHANTTPRRYHCSPQFLFKSPYSPSFVSGVYTPRKFQPCRYSYFSTSLNPRLSDVATSSWAAHAFLPYDPVPFRSSLRSSRSSFSLSSSSIFRALFTQDSYRHHLLPNSFHVSLPNFFPRWQFSSSLFATHGDLPPWEPTLPSDEESSSSSSPAPYLSVPIDDIEAAPSYYPRRLPLPMHTFHPPSSSSLPPSASCLPPSIPSTTSPRRYARAEARYQRLSPIKTRRVLHEIRGMSLGAALAHLATSPRRPAYQVFKTIQSALANAIHMYGEATLQPRIKELTANNGPVFKRPFFRARGKMDIRRRPTTHIRVVLEV